MQLEIKILRLMSLLSICSVAIALVSQYFYDMQPCAWCVFQRLLYLIIGLVSYLVTLGQPRKLLLALGAGFALAGAIAGVASAWYQEKVASNNFSCAQTLADQIMTQTGFDAAVPWLFGIYASCMDARVKLLGIEYAWWSLAMFTLLGLLGIVALKKIVR